MDNWCGDDSRPRRQREAYPDRASDRRVRRRHRDSLGGTRYPVRARVPGGRGASGLAAAPPGMGQPDSARPWLGLAVDG